MAKVNYKALAILALLSVGYFVVKANEPADLSEEKISQAAPDIQKAFISIVTTAQKKSQEVKNDMQLGGVKASRDTELCNLLEDKSVVGWIGKVVQVSSNGDGKGVFGVEVAKNVAIRTANNSFSDIGDHTLIDPSSQLFADASALKPGDMVSFSGRFIVDREECLREISVTLDGSVKEPDFMFRFNEVGKI